MCVKSLQSCLTLCDTMNCSPPGSPVHGILQARMLEWVAMPSSRGSSQSRDPNYVSYVCLLHWHAVSLPLTPALGSLYVCMHVYIQYIYVFCAVLSHSDSTQGLNSGPPHCRFFTVWAPGKLKNTGVGSLSLLQEIFLTQESNWDFLHCWQILYQLSCQGSPNIYICIHTHTHTHTISHHLQEMHTYIYTHHLSPLRTGIPDMLQSMGWGCKELNTTEQLNNINIHTYILFRVFPTRGYYKILNIVPYATQ